MNRRHFVLLCTYVTLATASAAESTAETTEVAATILGKEITLADLDLSPRELQIVRRQLSKEPEDDLLIGARLSSLIWKPILTELTAFNNLEPSADEIDAYLQATSEISDRILEDFELGEQFTAAQIAEGRNNVAKQSVRTWKVSKFLFEEHGGRVIFQQGNPVEPVDAYRKLLEQLRDQGVFQIHNEILQNAFWSYYLRDLINVIPADQIDFSTPWWSQIASDELVGSPEPSSLSIFGCFNNWICGNGFEFFVPTTRPLGVCRLSNPGFSTAECAQHDAVCAPDIRTRVNGCSGPYIPFFSSFFERACNEHDVCYNTPDTTKVGDCDNNFLNDMSVLCQGALLKPTCYSYAIDFYAAVRTFGGPAFREDKAWGLAQCRPDDYLSYESDISPGFCIDAKGGNHANGTNAQLFQCNDTNAQRWKFTNSGDVRSALRENVCLDVEGGRFVPGTNVQLYQCNNTNAQLWSFTDQGTITSGPNLCLDVTAARAENGTNIWAFQCNGTAAQQWTFKPQQVGGTAGVFQSALGDFCLDISGGRFISGNNVQLYRCNNTAAQLWTNDNGIIQSSGQTLCLDVAGGRAENRTNVQIFDCNGTPAQQWTLKDEVVHSRVNNVEDNLCLSVAGAQAEDGANLQISTCGDLPSQRWVQRVD